MDACLEVGGLKRKSEVNSRKITMKKKSDNYRKPKWSYLTKFAKYKKNTVQLRKITKML